jgi:hypothetical protein
MTVGAAQVNRRANEVVQAVPRIDVQHTLADKVCIRTKLMSKNVFFYNMKQKLLIICGLCTYTRGSTKFNNHFDSFG